MKLRTRLLFAFLTIVIVPIVSTTAFILTTMKAKTSFIRESYGYQTTNMTALSNSIKVLSTITEQNVEELKKISRETPEKMENWDFLSEYNSGLSRKMAYLIVRKDENIVFFGGGEERLSETYKCIEDYGNMREVEQGGIYLGGNLQMLFKPVSFVYPDGSRGTAYIVSRVSSIVPEMEQFVLSIMLEVIVILILTAFLLILWIYLGVIEPLGRMKDAAQRIREGDLDFQLEPWTEDELGQLTQNLEDMRKRLWDNAQEKLEYDRENRELISNISHDLKTPVTTIKGYAEGIMDGVADTPEKMDKYIKTIYNKASEMGILINELTFYSQIDTNRIPYNFSPLSVERCFGDCAEDLSLELSEKDINFGYCNYAGEDVRIIADAEQIKRVVHNIINNSVKYRRAGEAKINLRVFDKEEFVQVEIEDNGKGIAQKDIPHIFDRFYRTDASRNSLKGGSGIGLSIVKKIVEDHGGHVWATSKEGTGTTVCFDLRKYQEE